MILRYLYAALSSVLPLLSIFRQGAVLEWTRTLSSSVLPHFLELPLRDLIALPPASEYITESATDLDLTLSTVPDQLLNSIDIYSHPFNEAAAAFWRSVIPFADVSKQHVLLYVFVALTSVLLTCFVSFARRSFNRPRSTSVETARLDIQRSLEHIDKMGGVHSDCSAPPVPPADLNDVCQEQTQGPVETRFPVTFAPSETHGGNEDTAMVESIPLSSSDMTDSDLLPPEEPFLLSINSGHQNTPDQHTFDVHASIVFVETVASNPSEDIHRPSEAHTSTAVHVLPLQHTTSTIVDGVHDSEVLSDSIVMVPSATPFDDEADLSDIEFADRSTASVVAENSSSLERVEVTLMVEEHLLEALTVAASPEAEQISVSDVFQAPVDNRVEEDVIPIDGPPFVDTLFSSSSSPEVSSPPVQPTDSVDVAPPAEFIPVEASIALEHVSTGSHPMDSLVADVASNCQSGSLSVTSPDEYFSESSLDPSTMTSDEVASSPILHPATSAEEMELSEAFSLKKDYVTPQPDSAEEVLPAVKNDEIVDCQHIIVSSSEDLDTTLIDAAPLLPSADILPKMVDSNVTNSDDEHSGDDVVSVKNEHSDSADVDVKHPTTTPEEPAIIIDLQHDKPASDTLANPQEPTPFAPHALAVEDVCTATPGETLPIANSFSLDPLLETSLQAAQANQVEEISTLGANGIANLALDESFSFVIHKDVASAFMPQASSSVMDILAASFSSSSGSEEDFIVVPSSSFELSSAGAQDIESVVSIVSPAVSSESSHSIMFNVDFPFMSADPTIFNAFGEHLNEQDWTLVNIALNEEGKFVFGGMTLPIDGSLSSLTSTSRVSSLDFDSLAEPGSLVIASRHSHSKSDSELLHFRNVYRKDVEPVSPTKFEGPEEQEFHQLTLRQGLINHDEAFDLYEPPEEMRIAIRTLRRLLDTTRIPEKPRGRARTRSQAPTQFPYGLTAEVFLGWMRDEKLRRTTFTKSFADAVRGKPSILTITYNPPTSGEPPKPAFIGPMPVVASNINRSRGGQDKSQIHLQQVEIDREKARKMSATKAPRHPNYYVERSSRLSVESQSATVRTRRSSTPGTFMTSPVTVNDPPATGDKQRTLHRVRSDSVLRSKRYQGLDSNLRFEHFDKPSSANLSERCSSSVEAPRQSSLPRGRKSEVARAPLLETIAASPPISPSGTLNDIVQARDKMPGFDETLARSLDFSTPPPSSVITISTGQYARVDDENALLGFRDDGLQYEHEQSRRPSSSSGSSRRSSFVQSTKQPVWKP
ncbi:unnamed protein product [Somion occarium]|uniref:Transmembrane protein n=1 Tax=Somion occarium TaxID=3059160 RepID=A0ABP1DX48_9APHY